MHDGLDMFDQMMAPEEEIEAPYKSIDQRTDQKLDFSTARSKQQAWLRRNCKVKMLVTAHSSGQFQTIHFEFCWYIPLSETFFMAKVVFCKAESRLPVLGDLIYSE